MFFQFTIFFRIVLIITYNFPEDIKSIRKSLLNIQIFEYLHSTFYRQPSNLYGETNDAKLIIQTKVIVRHSFIQNKKYNESPICENVAIAAISCQDIVPVCFEIGSKI